MSEPLMMLAAVIIGYLLGSIPFGLLLTRLGGKGDIRDIGSGNIGATNVLRSGSKVLALLTLLADAAKGFIAVAVVWSFADNQAAFLAGLAAFAGHLFPVWLNFKGGKGIAVFIGAMLAMSPLTGILFLVVWLLTALVFRISSLAAIVALLTSVPLLLLLGEQVTAFYTILMVGLSLYAHRENIARLRAGTEPKIGS